MTTPELAFLQALALTLSHKATVVELGSWRGRSTVALSPALSDSAQLYAVDMFSGTSVTSGGLRENELERFLANTSRFGRIEPLVSDTAAAAEQSPNAASTWFSSTLTIVMPPCAATSPRGPRR